MRRKEDRLEGIVARQAGGHVAAIGTARIIRGGPATCTQLSNQELRYCPLAT